MQFLFYSQFVPFFSLSLDFLTPADEAIMIMDSVHFFLSLTSDDDSPLPWDFIGTSDFRSKDREVKIQAIEDHLGVLLDGSAIPLTVRQRMFFRTPMDKLEYKIRKARLEAVEIVETIGSYKSWENDIKDTRLMRQFVLECLSPFKRFTLENDNVAHDDFASEKASWSVFLLSWIFITFTLCFFIYWILQWGLYEGGDHLSVWGAVYGTGAAQDILLVSVTKVIVVKYLPAHAMQAQLLRIRRVLADVSLNYINHNENELHTVHTGKSMNQVKKSNIDTISVVQHMSAACRAARSKRLKALPAAWLLRQVCKQHTNCNYYNSKNAE